MASLHIPNGVCPATVSRQTAEPHGITDSPPILSTPTETSQEFRPEELAYRLRATSTPGSSPGGTRSPLPAATKPPETQNGNHSAKPTLYSRLPRDPLLPSNPRPKRAFTGTRPKENTYRRRDLGCPCPGVATLVNHNYLNPKDENDRVSWYCLASALVACYNMAWTNAIFLSVVAVVVCGNYWAVSMKELGAHGRVEHDASISRPDQATGRDWTRPDTSRIKNFIGTGCPIKKRVTLDNYAQQRCSIESYLYPVGGLSYWWDRSKLAALGRGEVALTMRVFGGDEQIDPDEGMWVKAAWLQTWFSEERLPDDWSRPAKPFGFWETAKVGWNLNQRMKTIRQHNEQLRQCARFRDPQASQ